MDERSKQATAGTSVNEDNLHRLIEQVSRDLREQATHEQIRQAVIEAAAGFRGATVTAYIPLFIRRLAREALQKKLEGGAANV